MKKRAILINYEYPPIGGGGANASFHIANELKEHFELTVITTHFKGLKIYEKKNDIRVFRLFCLRGSLHKSRFIELILFTINACVFSFFLLLLKRYHHVIIFFSFPFGIIGRILKLFFGVSYSLFIRGADVKGFLKELDCFFKISKSINFTIYKHAHSIFTNGIQLKNLTDKYLIELGLDMKVHNAPNGVNTSFFYNSEKTIDTKNIKFLFVGRIVDSQKNVFILPEIFRQLNSKNWTLYIVGDGLDYKQLKFKFENYRLQEKVIFHKWLNKEYLRDIYEKTNVLLLPSHSEGVSNVLLEAISSGLYVLAGDIPDNCEILTKYPQGKIIPHNSVEVYVAEIEKILRNGCVPNLKISRKNLDWTHTAQIIKEIIL